MPARGAPASAPCRASARAPASARWRPTRGASCTSSPRPWPVPCVNSVAQPAGRRAPPAPPDPHRPAADPGARPQSPPPAPPGRRRAMPAPRRRGRPRDSARQVDAVSAVDAAEVQHDELAATRWRRSDARPCGSAARGPEATMVSNAGRSNPARRRPASTAWATEVSVTPGRRSARTPRVTADSRAPPSRSRSSSHGFLHDPA